MLYTLRRIARREFVHIICMAKLSANAYLRVQPCVMTYSVLQPFLACTIDTMCVSQFLSILDCEVVKQVTGNVHMITTRPSN